MRKNHRTFGLNLFLGGASALVLAACGGGGGGGGGAAPAPVTSSIVANAGPASTVVAGTTVRLDASSSYDKNGGVLTYQWSQVSGPAVTLTNGDTATPTFTAPATAGDIVLRVTAATGGQNGTSDVTIQNRPFGVRAGKIRTTQATTTGGATVANTKNFTVSGGTNFNAAGVAPGDTLLVLEGTDYGFYRVNKVNSNTSITVQAPTNFTGTNPATWVVLNEAPYFLGYGTTTQLQAVVIGATVGTLSYSWTGASSGIPVTGTSTNTVTVTTPTLPSLLPIPQEGGTLAVRGTAMGRFQLKITVKDDNGTPGDVSDDLSDSRYVNVSCGQMNGGLENVPLGEPVFLSGGTFRKSVSNSSFALEAGKLFTYKLAETAKVRAVYQNTTPLLEMTSIDGVEGTPGTFFWNAGTVYIHATDDSSVLTNGIGYSLFVADNWSWVVTDPTGATVTLLRPNKTAVGSAVDERTPYFIPTRLGAYTVILTRGVGSTVDAKSYIVNVAQFVGVGTIVGTAPNQAKGECGSCHGGSIPFLENIREQWEQTGHAVMFTNGMTPGTALYSSYQAKVDWKDVYCMQCHTTGNAFTNPLDLSQALTTVVAPTTTASGHLPNSGFDDISAQRNWNHIGMTWDTLKDKEPSIASRGNIQCESCHGPGSAHVGDTTAIRKTIDEGVCARCHSHQPNMWDWAGHARIVPSPSGNATCVNCHEASGSIQALALAASQAEPREVFWANPATPFPVQPEDRRRGETCQVCHDPHAKSTGSGAGTGVEQLRLTGQVKFINGATNDAGKAALCFMCHNSRTNTLDYTPGTGHMAIRRAPHDSTAAEMISKTNGIEYQGAIYKSSPHAMSTAFIVPGNDKAEWCISCHMAPTPSAGSAGYEALGGHSWKLEQGGAHGATTTVSNETTNTGGAVTANAKSFTVTGGPTFLNRVAPGDKLVLVNGSDAGSYVITSVDNGTKVTVSAGSNFTGAVQPTTWRIDSVPKYLTTACTQCHPVGPGFELLARGDYDGDAVLESVQEETEGMLTKLRSAVETQLNDPNLPKVLGGGPYTFMVASGRVSYKNAAGTTRSFPGPGGAGTTQQSDWDALDQSQQDWWERLYKACYNWYFVEHDWSEGIHNTGYTVGLLQGSYKDVTGNNMGAAFTTMAGYDN